MEVSAASVPGYATPQDFEASFDAAGQQEPQQDAAPAQDAAPSDTATPRGSSLPPDSAIHPSIATQLMQSVVSGAKETASFVQNAVRTADAKKEQLGSWIDSGEKYLESKIDDGRAWLSEHGGAIGRNAATQIGLAEGVAISVYDAGKGIVQLVDGASSLSSTREWIANPQANIARLKTVASSVETMGKLALLTNPATAPAAWMADPQGNAQLAGALWNSAATSFNKDPAKFVGNAIGTIGMMAIPGGGEAAIASDVGRGAALLNDASRITKGLDIAADVSKAKTLAEAGNMARQEQVLTKGTSTLVNAAKGEQNTAVAVGAPKGAEAVAKGADAAPGPVNFMGNSDQFFKNAANRADIDPNGMFDVVAHGTSTNIEIMTAKGPVAVDQRVASRLIEQSAGYHPGQPIRLLSCDTGACDVGFAQNLANKMGVPVQAPTDLVWAYGDGKIVVAHRMSTNPDSLYFNVPDLSKQGTFKTFLPGGNKP